jgi:hypothetical protein
MKMTRTLIAASVLLALAGPTHAENFCLTVRGPISDGFAALRAGPGTQFETMARMLPGDLLYADTRNCNDGVCDTTGRWTFVDEETAGRAIGGWVASRLTQPVQCPPAPNANPDAATDVPGDALVQYCRGQRETSFYDCLHQMLSQDR